MSEPLLSCRGVSVDYVTSAGEARACNRVTLDIHPGETVGLAGVRETDRPLTRTQKLCHVIKTVAHLRKRPIQNFDLTQCKVGANYDSMLFPSIETCCCS